jgi:adenine deaminase
VWVVGLPEMTYPEWTLNSVHLSQTAKAGDFRIRVRTPLPMVKVNVIGVIENQAPTRHLVHEMPVINGEVKADWRNDLAKVAVLDRHHDSGRMATGFVSGFGFTEPCAVASTVAHDCHQLIVVGTEDENMAIAVNTLRECQGGQVVVRNQQVIGLVPLPIGGLMSMKTAETVSREADSVLAGIQACGCRFQNANMQLSLLALVVIPELRLSDLGLFDAAHFQMIPLIDSDKGGNHD